MVKDNNLKNYSLIAGLCFLLVGVFNIYYIISDILEYGTSEYTYTFCLYIFEYVILIGIAVTLFVKNKKGLLIASALYAVLSVYYLVYYLVLYFVFRYSLNFIACAGFAVLVLLMILKNKVVKNIWFIPAAVLLLFYLWEWIYFDYFMNLQYAWLDILVSLVMVAGFAFTGLWIKEETDAVIVTERPKADNTYTAFNPRNIGGGAPVIGGADKLRSCKELLDAGIITQEEFEEKKKQILGL